MRQWNWSGCGGQLKKNEFTRANNLNFQSGATTEPICNPAGIGSRAGRTHNALPGKAECVVDVFTCDPGAFRPYFTRGDGLDRQKARLAADQYLRIGDVLSHVPADAGGQAPHQGLPDFELRIGRQP